MTFLIILVIVALLAQIGLFFFTRAKKGKLKSGVIGKYNIKTVADAWRLINDPSISESERLEIEKFYEAERSGN